MIQPEKKTEILSTPKSHKLSSNTATSEKIEKNKKKEKKEKILNNSEKKPKNKNSKADYLDKMVEKAVIENIPESTVKKEIRLVEDCQYLTKINNQEKEINETNG